MKKVFVVGALAVIVIAASGVISACASGHAAAPPPEWVSDMRAVYPDHEYIAQQGIGKTRKDAELNGLSAISQYFETQISTEIIGHDSWATENGVTTAVEQFSQDITVQSQTSLIAVRYADDPWYNGAAKEWHTVAYINCNEAWTLYEPQVKKVSAPFLALYNAADAEIDPFTRALRFSAAAPYVLNEGYSVMRNFGQILNPSKAQAAFAASDAARALLPEKITTARQQATVYIDCEKDYSGLLYNAAVSVLSEEGFPVESDPDAASCVCAITVDEGEQAGENSVFFYPALNGTITGETGAVFSFSAKTARQGALDPDLAKRRAYTALAAALKESFVEGLNKKRSSFEQK
ncbi:MAG: LPP20 family lipoprotein [Spirochaetaceae bacterium]|jgi:hypothetical protein|nr:LPP20 family lipoprotein [Spirochaetaceae bacterium]